jgi:hypothetical protein
MQSNLPKSLSSGSSFGSSSSGASSFASMGFNINSLFTGWGATIVIVFLLVIVFAVYYQTIGYYFNLGWDRLAWSKDNKEKVHIDTPVGDATMTPAPEPAPNSIGKTIKKLESDVEAALSAVTGPNDSKKQVFNIARNAYTFSEAEPLCRAYGAELATYDQVKEAYKSGADWCNYGWVKGQLAVYPTQKATYDKLQDGPEADRMMCGLPGVNGGFFPNEDQRFGVNCYGARPAETALDKLEHRVEQSDIAFDRQVNHFKSELNSIPVNPFSADSWSA